MALAAALEVLDPTASVRKTMAQEINDDAFGRPAMEAHYGKVWDTRELGAEFEVKGFLAPFVTVKRKSDGQEGTMLFQHSPRLYYAFQEVR